MRYLLSAATLVAVAEHVPCTFHGAETAGGWSLPLKVLKSTCLVRQRK